MDYSDELKNTIEKEYETMKDVKKAGSLALQTTKAIELELGEKPFSNAVSRMLYYTILFIIGFETVVGKEEKITFSLIRKDLTYIFENGSKDTISEMTSSLGKNIPEGEDFRSEIGRCAFHAGKTLLILLEDGSNALLTEYKVALSGADTELFLDEK